MSANFLAAAFLTFPAAAWAASPLPELEAECARLEQQVASSKAREKDAVKRRLESLAAGYEADGDPAARAEAAAAAERLRQSLSREWIDSPEQDALMSRVRSEIRELDETKETWGGRDSSEAKERLAAAKRRVLQAEFAYFNGREAFTASRLESYWRDLASELADSYGEVASVIVGKMVRQFADKLEKFSQATDKASLFKALGELGTDLASDFTTELFSAGLKEAWVKGVIVDERVPRYFADELYSRFIIPDREKEKSLEAAFATGIAKGAFGKLADAQTQDLQEELLKSVTPEELDVLKEVLTFEDITKLAELSGEGKLDGGTVLKLVEQKLVKLGPAVLEKNWEKLQKLPVFKGKLAGFGVYKSATDMVVQGAAFLENGWSGASSGALKRSVEDFRGLADFTSRHPRLAVDPEQEFNKALVADAVFTGAIQWRGEAQAYERAVALDASAVAGTPAQAEEAASAWRAVVGVRPGKTWRPFLVVARQRLAYWKALPEKPAASARWQGEPEVPGVFDHGDTVRFSAGYSVSGLQEGAELTVTESTAFDEGDARKTTRRYVKDGTGKVAVSYEVPESAAPGEHAVVLGLWDGSSAWDTLRIGFSVTDLYPAWAGRLSDAEGEREACALKASAASLASLDAEMAARKKPNGLVRALHGRVRGALGRSQEALRLEARALAAYTEAGQTAFPACDWSGALRRAEAALEARRGLPAACAAGTAPFEQRAAEMRFHQANQAAFERHAAAGDKALRSCRLEEAADEYSMALALYNGNLADLGCARLGTAAERVKAQGAAAERRLALQTRVAGLVEQSREHRNAEREKEGLAAAQQALAAAQQAPEDDRPCLDAQTRAAAELAKAAGQALKPPATEKLLAGLPKEDPAEVPAVVKERREEHLEDQRRARDEKEKRLREERAAQREAERERRREEEEERREDERVLRMREAWMERAEKQLQERQAARDTFAVFTGQDPDLQEVPADDPHGDAIAEQLVKAREAQAAEIEASRRLLERQRSEEEAARPAAPPADSGPRGKEGRLTGHDVARPGERREDRLTRAEGSPSDEAAKVAACQAQIAPLIGTCPVEWLLENSGFKATTCGLKFWVDFSWERAGTAPPDTPGGMRKVRIDKDCTRRLMRCQGAKRFPC